MVVLQLRTTTHLSHQYRIRHLEVTFRNHNRRILTVIITLGTLLDEGLVEVLLLYLPTVESLTDWAMKLPQRCSFEGSDMRWTDTKAPWSDFDPPSILDPFPFELSCEQANVSYVHS